MVFLTIQKVPKVFELVEILTDHLEKEIHRHHNFDGNEQEVIFFLVEANQDKTHWLYLSLNSNAIHLLEANQSKIDWYILSINLNAIHLLEQAANQDQINWLYLSENPKAIYLLEANQEIEQSNLRI